MQPKAVRAGMGGIIKSAVLGAFLGAFVVCGCVFLQYFFYKKLRSADELKERYGYYILGDLYRPKQKKSGPIDRILDKWADLADRRQNPHGLRENAAETYGDRHSGCGYVAAGGP